MRLAFFSPMPPSRSGIADYSAALLPELERLAEVELFMEPPSRFDPRQFELALYQVGNNPHHGFVYKTALDQPGVVVLHEANLHHLVADLTIGRNDWDAYVAEAEYNGGAPARAHAERARTREVGPDYEGVPMLRRLLERSKALIVHSSAVETAARIAGFEGPIAKIPHGAWIPPEVDRWGFRDRLGVDTKTPLVGIFGFLKPYKRIPESFRAFRRLLKVEPKARMILVGETHPDFPVRSLIGALGLTGSVHVLGYTAIENFVGYMAACDVVLNLRYPTVGETSGSLLRALGLARPVLVSDIGAFRDLPDEICLKVPVDSNEESQIFEFLQLLVTRPHLARELGQRGQDWVKRECTWDVVAVRYASFLNQVSGNAALGAPSARAAAAGASPAPAPPVERELPEPAETARRAATAQEIVDWVPPVPVMRAYVDTHLTRLTKTLAIIPPGGPGDRVLEMGSYLQITPALKRRLGYGEVRGSYYGTAGVVEQRTVTSEDGQAFTCPVDLFNAESDRFPYPDEHFATVLCCEIIEHLVRDPMHMLSEVNRILRPGGHLVLTTPNIASMRAIAAVLQGYHPGLFPQYIKPAAEGAVDPRHSREYTPREVHHLLENAGFEVLRLETGPFREQPTPELAWVRQLLDRFELSSDLRDDGVYAVGRKTGPVRERYPSWLYA